MNWLLNLNQLCEGLWAGTVTGLLISMLKNLNLFWSKNIGALDVKMDGSVFEEKLSSKMLGLFFSSNLDWGFYMVSIAKNASKRIEA